VKSEMLVERVRRFALRHTLFEPGPVVVAVSGGADSLTLLHVLMALRDTFDITLHAATFDHGIRGAAGAQDVQAVREIAAKWDIPVTAGSADVPTLAKNWSLGLEAAARRARYDFLAQAAEALNIKQIATGHNQDDQAETVLMHVIRGSGLAGLRGMLPKMPLPSHNQLNLIRPLLETPRAEIDEYISALGIQPRTDATNLDTHYTRNRLRHDVLPLLAEINPQVRAALARTAETAREDYAALRFVEPTFTLHSWGLSMERIQFVALTRRQQRLLIHTAAERLSPGDMVSFERTQAAIDLVLQNNQPVSRIPLIGDLWFGTRGGHIWVGLGTLIGPDFNLSELEPTYPSNCPYLKTGTSIELDTPGFYALPGDGGVQWQLHVEAVQEATSSQGDSAGSGDGLTLLLRVEAGASVLLRTRRSGDVFRPRGMHGRTQKLKDALINMKIPASWRGHLPIVTINDRIAGFVVPTASGPKTRLAEDNSAGNDDSLWQFTFARLDPS